MSKSVRPVGGEAFNAMEFLQKVGKSKPVAGIVEAVLNGSTLRVTLLPDLTSVRWGGVQSCRAWWRCGAAGPGAVWVGQEAGVGSSWSPLCIRGSWACRGSSFFWHGIVAVSPCPSLAVGFPTRRSQCTFRASSAPP